jgi:hypothetical protein
MGSKQNKESDTSEIKIKDPTSGWVYVDFKAKYRAPYINKYQEEPQQLEVYDQAKLEQEMKYQIFMRNSCHTFSPFTFSYEGAQNRIS